MEFSRYAKRPMGRLYTMAQPQNAPGWPAPPKPRGLWLSVDGPDDWYAWCMSERFPCGHLRYKVRVDTARCLHMTTAEELRNFTKTYHFDVSHIYNRPGERQLNWYGHYINWREVARDYPGIIISPYQWQSRMEFMWYYTWDCASACVWDMEIIGRVKRMRSGEKTRLRAYTKHRARQRKRFNFFKTMRKLKRKSGNNKDIL
jgi:hypothetical protein